VSCILPNMKDSARFSELDDWPVLCQFLPEGWQDQAHASGALRRARGLADPATLLRVLLVHLAGGCSLKETVTRARQAGWCSISAVALFKRLRAAEQWLRWLAERLWQRRATPLFRTRYRVRAVDATTVQEPGSTGTDWRVHYVLDLADMQCDFYELTDAQGGETFRRIPVAGGDLLLGDRAYSTPPGIAHVTKQGGDVLVRVNHKALPLYQGGGTPIPLVRWLRSVAVGQVQEWPAWVGTGTNRIAGRLIAVKRSRYAARLARARLRKNARKKQKSLSRSALFASGYVFVWTTAPRRVLGARAVLELYRLRWQIELAFKRMKSLMGLGQLPKTSAASCRAWIHGKLLVALLLERLLEEAENVSPWGYELADPAEPVAGSALVVP
jgi:hypothetical protein